MSIESRTVKKYPIYSLFLHSFLQNSFTKKINYILIKDDAA